MRKELKTEHPKITTIKISTINFINKKNQKKLIVISQNF